MNTSSTNQNISVNEAKIIRRLLRTAKKNGWAFEVYEGEDLAFERGDHIENAIKSLGSTGQDWIRFYDSENKKVGVAWFIYGNGNEGLDCLTDHSSDEGKFDQLMEELGDYIDSLS